MTLRRWAERLWTNDVETGGTPAYPDVRPLELAAPADAAYTLAREAASAMVRWRVVEDDPVARRLRAEARTRLLRFVDDVAVWIDSLPGGPSRVFARSASRVGVTDFGTNARRLRAYLERVASIAAAAGYSVRRA